MRAKQFSFRIDWSASAQNVDIPVVVFNKWYNPDKPIFIGFPYHGLELSVDKVREIRDTLTRAIDWYERKTK